MGLVSKQATSSTTPDPGQDGSSVTGATNTGHGSTTVSTVGLDDQFATCIWTGFSPPAGLARALMFDWSEDGSNTGGGVNNFRVQYSTNGGANWTNAINHTPITAAANGSALVAITADVAQVQVRDFIEASSPDGGTSSVTASVSNIKLEVVTNDGLI